jgi:hypothetical protein
MIQSKWWPCSKSNKAGAPAVAMLAHVESIVACKVPKQTGRSKDVSLLHEPKDVDSTDSHTQKSIVFSPSPQQCTPPSMDHWMEARTCSWRDACVWILFCEIYTSKSKSFFFGSETAGISSFRKRSRCSEEIKDLASTQKSKIKESTKALDLH